MYGKSTHVPILKTRESGGVKELGEEVHSDVWGPAPVATIGGKCYYVSFIDDHTRLATVKFLCTKDEVFNNYKNFEAYLRTQYNQRIRFLHSD